MGIIERYVLWRGHDAGGMLPPVDVLAGVMKDADARRLEGGTRKDEGDTLVFVPPQWIGDWETGFRLAPAYQHVWRAPGQQLVALPDPPRDAPYRPAELPPAARGLYSISRHARMMTRGYGVGESLPEVRGGNAERADAG
jgi:hypothetical protein